MSAIKQSVIFITSKLNNCYN